VESTVSWQYDYLLPEISSPVGDGERFYFGTAIGDLVSLNATTGEEAWVHECEDGFSSSPVLVGDLLYVGDMAGNMYIMKASDTFELVAQIPMGEPVYATPAFLDGRMYIRTETKLYCIEAS
jgi:outer membrane protein assembly factor BamB